jgi:Domain of unknown function (DUF4397)
MSSTPSIRCASSRFFVPLVAAAAIVVQACEDATGISPDNASVRVVHASPAAASIDVLLNGQASVENPNIGFGEATGCFGVNADDPQLTFRRSTGATIPGPETFGFARQERFIVVVWGAPGDLRFTSVRDDADPPPLQPGRARVRLFNATSVPGRVYVYATPTGSPRVLVDTLLVSGYTPYLNVPAGAVQLQVNQGSGETVLGIIDVGVAPGQEMTVIAVDPPVGVPGLGWVLTETCPARE